MVLADPEKSNSKETRVTLNEVNPDKKAQTSVDEEEEVINAEEDKVVDFAPPEIGAEIDEVEAEESPSTSMEPEATISDEVIEEE